MQISITPSSTIPRYLCTAPALPRRLLTDRTYLKSPRPELAPGRGKSLVPRPELYLQSDTITEASLIENAATLNS